jgi:hypothetical protein
MSGKFEIGDSVRVVVFKDDMGPTSTLDKVGKIVEPGFGGPFVYDYRVEFPDGYDDLYYEQELELVAFQVGDRVVVRNSPIHAWSDAHGEIIEGDAKRLGYDWHVRFDANNGSVPAVNEAYFFERELEHESRVITATNPFEPINSAHFVISEDRIAQAAYEPKLRFEAGDKVRIVQDLDGNDFRVGEVGIIDHIDPEQAEGYVYIIDLGYETVIAREEELEFAPAFGPVEERPFVRQLKDILLSAQPALEAADEKVDAGISPEFLKLQEREIRSDALGLAIKSVEGTGAGVDNVLKRAVKFEEYLRG